MSERTTEERLTRLEEALEDLAFKMGYRIVKIENKTGLVDRPYEEFYKVAMLD